MPITLIQAGHGDVQPDDSPAGIGGIRETADGPAVDSANSD